MSIWRARITQATSELRHLGPLVRYEPLRRIRQAYDGPAKTVARVIGADVELRGRTLRRGDRVFLCPASANRAPAAFTDPDRLDITRREERQLGFGLGLHYCLGAPLARMEVEEALLGLSRAFPRYTVSEQELHYAQVGAVVDEVGGEGVAQDVRRELLAGNGARAVAADQVPERLGRHAAPPPRGEDCI